MNKYLSLAAVLGAIAILSVSYLAQADQHAATEATTTMAVEAPAAPVDAFAASHEECTTMAAAATTEGAMPTDEQKAASYKSCMMGKGHTEEQMKAHEAAATPDAAPAAEGAVAPEAAH